MALLMPSTLLHVAAVNGKLQITIDLTFTIDNATGIIAAYDSANDPSSPHVETPQMVFNYYSH